MKMYDKNSLKTLFKYNPLKPEEISKEEFEKAKILGLMFEKQTFNHNQSAIFATEEFRKTNKKNVADHFIIGTSRNLSVSRSALSAYAVMTHFSIHEFKKKSHESLHCDICGSLPTFDVDFSFINRCRWTGCLVNSPSPIDCGFYLQRFNAELIDEHPSNIDIDIFCEILHLIKNCPPDERPLTLCKKIRKFAGIQMSLDEARYFIDSLGYAGILQTQHHIGFIYKYHGHLTPRSSRNSDWAYPVDFWRGSDGINRNALDYWFSHHEKIKNWN